MHMECPHCKTGFDTVDGFDTEIANCPNCGGSIKIDREATATSEMPFGGQIGNYRLMTRLGSGSSGYVWQAEDERLHRKVALKLSHFVGDEEESFDRYLREARLAAKLTHPHIVPVLDVGRVANNAFIVSGLIDGTSLSEQLKTSDCSWKRYAEWTAQLADALQHAHEAGIIHRDVKPSNVLIDSRGRAYLTDFGIARNLQGTSRFLEEAKFVGTLAYMSPEQVRGESDQADARSDVYSLGVVLYEMLTGKRPFSGSTAKLIDQILNDEPEAPTRVRGDVPFELEEICLKALRKNPQDRYQSAGEMAEAVRKYLSCEVIATRQLHGGNPESKKRAEVTVAENSERTVRERRPLSRRRVAFFATTMLAILTMPAAAMVNNWVRGGRETKKRAELEDDESRRTPEDGSASDERTVQRRWLLANAAQNGNPEGAVVQNVVISTEPDGAKIVIYPLDSFGEPMPKHGIRPQDRTPVTVDLVPGDYFVVAVLDDGRFHEVWRRVPFDLTALPFSESHRAWQVDEFSQIEWPVVAIPSKDMIQGMVEFEGNATFQAGVNANVEYSNEVPAHKLTVGPFLIDPLEYTFGDYRREFGRIQRASEKTQKEPVSDAEPLYSVSHNEAMHLAELKGKRLPTQFEWEFAGTVGVGGRDVKGTVEQELSQWGGMPAEDAGVDVLSTNPPLRGMHSSLGELTASAMLPYPATRSYGIHNDPTEGREVGIVVKGIPELLLREGEAANGGRVKYLAQMRFGLARTDMRRRVGFRCARSVKPHISEDDF